MHVLVGRGIHDAIVVLYLRVCIESNKVSVNGRKTCRSKRKHGYFSVMALPLPAEQRPWSPSWNRTSSTQRRQLAVGYSHRTTWVQSIESILGLNNLSTVEISVSDNTRRRL